MPPNKQSTARGIIRECRLAEGCEGMGGPRRSGALPSVAGVRVGYVVRRLASPNAPHNVFGVFDAVRRPFPESGLVSFYGLLVLLRYLDLCHALSLLRMRPHPPMGPCWRLCRACRDAARTARRSSPSLSSLSLSSSIMGVAKDCLSIVLLSFLSSTSLSTSTASRAAQRGRSLDARWRSSPQVGPLPACV